jgi:peptidoglycan hydrolase-like protein with peptidoglycan-binding domain
MSARRKRRSPPPRRAPGVLGRALAMLAARPVATLASLAGSSLIGVIAVNALMLQPGPHPAPLFARQASEPGAPAPSGDPALVRDVQAALRDLGFYSGPVDGLGGGGTEAAVRAFEAANGLPSTGAVTASLLARALTAPPRQAAEPSPKPVATAALSVQAPPARPDPAGPGGAAPGGSPEIRRIQKALADLGYGPLTVDGRAGGQTANAIRRFRLDHGLPLSGDIDARLVERLIKIGGLPAG